MSLSKNLVIYPKATDGAHNFWYLVNLFKGADKKYAGILKHELQQNSYFAYPENILLGMLTDDHKPICELHYLSTRIPLKELFSFQKR